MQCIQIFVNSEKILEINFRLEWQIQVLSGNKKIRLLFQFDFGLGAIQNNQYHCTNINNIQWLCNTNNDTM